MTNQQRLIAPKLLPTCYILKRIPAATSLHLPFPTCDPTIVKDLKRIPAKASLQSFSGCLQATTEIDEKQTYKLSQM
jgi:hypothetical protein